jgi:hypothetical protein
MQYTTVDETVGAWRAACTCVGAVNFEQCLRWWLAGQQDRATHITSDKVRSRRWQSQANSGHSSNQTSQRCRQARERTPQRARPRAEGAAGQGRGDPPHYTMQQRGQAHAGLRRHAAQTIAQLGRNHNTDTAHGRHQSQRAR